MVSVEEAKQQIQTARSQIESQRQEVQIREQEASQAEKQLRQARESLPAFTQRSLRQISSGLMGRLQRQQVERVRGDIGQKEKTITEFRSELESAKTQLSSFETDMGAYEREVQDIERQQDELRREQESIKSAIKLYEQGVPSSQLTGTLEKKYVEELEAQGALAKEVYAQQIDKLAEEITARGDIIRSVDLTTGEITFSPKGSISSLPKIDVKPIEIIESRKPREERDFKVFDLVSASPTDLKKNVSLGDDGFGSSIGVVGGGNILDNRTLLFGDSSGSWISRFVSSVKKDPYKKEIYSPKLDAFVSASPTGKEGTAYIRPPTMEERYKIERKDYLGNLEPFKVQETYGGVASDYLSNLQPLSQRTVNILSVTPEAQALRNVRLGIVELSESKTRKIKRELEKAGLPTTPEYVARYRQEEKRRLEVGSALPSFLTQRKVMGETGEVLGTTRIATPSIPSILLLGGGATPYGKLTSGLPRLFFKEKPPRIEYVPEERIITKVKYYDETGGESFVMRKPRDFDPFGENLILERIGGKKQPPIDTSMFWRLKPETYEKLITKRASIVDPTKRFSEISKFQKGTLDKLNLQKQPPIDTSMFWRLKPETYEKLITKRASIVDPTKRFSGLKTIPDKTQSLTRDMITSLEERFFKRQRVSGLPPDRRTPLSKTFAEEPKKPKPLEFKITFLKEEKPKVVETMDGQRQIQLLERPKQKVEEVAIFEVLSPKELRVLEKQKAKEVVELSQQPSLYELQSELFPTAEQVRVTRFTAREISQGKVKPSTPFKVSERERQLSKELTGTYQPSVLQASSTIDRERLRFEQRPTQLSKQPQREIQRDIVGLRQPQREKLKQPQIFKEFLENIFQKQREGTSERITTRERQRKKEPPKLLRIPLPKPKGKEKTAKEKVDEVFKVFVKRFGEDVEIGEFGTQRKAEEVLFGRLTTTLRASGFIEQAGKRIKVEERFGFKPSKVEFGRIVQEKGRRLKTPSEVSEIKLFKKSKKKSKTNVWGL